LAREREAEDRIQGDRAYRVTTGYDGIAQRLYAAIPEVHFNTIVSAIDWEPGAVTVKTHNGRAQFNARRVVVALPLGVLQAPSSDQFSVRFNPTIPEKQTALQGLQMGNVVKIAFAFKERFWERKFSDELGFLIAPDEPFRAWWTGYPLYAPVLVAWVGGPGADALAGLSTGQRAEVGVSSLARLLDLPRAVIEREMVAWESHDWAADPFARGAYSYVVAGGIQAQAALAKPVEDTLFFAGEATELAGHQATVHGAMYAGERAADEALRSFRSGL
jgi:monoamine oxidase